MVPSWLRQMAEAVEGYCINGDLARKIAKDVQLLHTATVNLLNRAEHVISNPGVVGNRVDLQEAVNKAYDAVAQFVHSDHTRTQPGPSSSKHYSPQESPPMYPLELTSNLHICLWDEYGQYKWTIALFEHGREGYSLRWVGDRPLDPRVDWEKFGEAVRQGQRMADELFKQEQEDL
jgi:hypothetical protein